MASKIPPERVEEVLAKSAAGAGTREIAAWLGSAHGVSVSHVTVARLVQRESAHRAAATKVIARAKLSGTIRDDIDSVEEISATAKRISASFEDDPAAWSRLARIRLDAIALRFKAAGLDQPDAQPAPPAVVLLPPMEEP